MSPTKKITIYDIAREAGISASTVAAVMNGSWKKRRIGEETAKTIETIAASRGYTINLQARGLRHSRSGLIGMIVPMLDNRFFSSLAQAFEEKTRVHGLYPVVVSTLRDPENEHSTVSALISHNVEALLLAGATDPDGLSEICSRAGVRHLNVDLPGTKAPSVISDNYNGAKEVTEVIVRAASSRNARPSLYFLGGIATDHNTQRRIEGFRDALRSADKAVFESHIQPTGYDANFAEFTVKKLYSRLGSLPDGLFVNSTIAFEGVVRFLKTLPIDEVRKCAIGCFDYDPFIELLHFPVVMARQNVKRLIDESYRLLEVGNNDAGRIVLIPTDLVVPNAMILSPQDAADSSRPLILAPSKPDKRVGRRTVA
jgi:LacI family transcriptional regulator, fructose operon transcriptional repressor